MNPSVNSVAGLPTLSGTTGSLQLKFTRDLSATDLTYSIIASNDMVNWTTLATLAAGSSSWTQSGATVTDNSGAVTVLDNTPIAFQPRRFLSLTVTGQ